MALFDEIQVRVYRSHVKIPLIFFVPALALLTLYSLAYFHTNSPHFWRAVEGQLHQVMGGHYSLGYVDVGPSLTSVEAYGVDLMTPTHDPVIRAQRVDASIDPLMLLTGRLEFDRGVVDGARVRLQYEDGSLNLLDALGVTDRRDDDRPDDDRRAVGFSDIELRNAEFEFVDQRFGFSVDDIDIPEASVFIEPATVLMAVDELLIPEADFWFEPQLFGFRPERGNWEFTARDFHIDDWQWVNEGFTVDHVSTEVDGIFLEASGRMVFPRDGDDMNMLYDATGSVQASYHSTVLDYFTGGNIRFDIAGMDVEASGDFDEIQGGFYNVYARALEANGIHLEHLRADVELDNRMLLADEVTGSMYGGELEAENAFFNMLDRKYGADLDVSGVDPRPLIADMTGNDQPFLEGELDGGLRLIGEIPPEARPRPSHGYVLAYDAMARYAEMEVIDDLTLRRDQDRMFPNERIDMVRGSQFWVDQRRLGLPQATVVSGDDRVDVQDFFLEYDQMQFERVDGSGPARLSASIGDIAPYASYYGLHGLEGGAEASMVMEGFFGSPRWQLSLMMSDPQWRLPDDELLDGDILLLELDGDRGDIEVRQAVAETDFGDFEAVGTAGWFEPPPPADDAGPPPIWEDRLVQPLDLDVAIRNLETSVISSLISDELQARGRLDADVELGGTVQQLRGGFRSSFRDGSVREQSIDSAKVRGNFQPDGLALDALEVDLGDAGRFGGDGRFGYDGDLDFELEAEDIDLAALRELEELPVGLQGRARLYVEGQGSIDDPHFSGGGQVEEMIIDDRIVGDVALAADTIDDIVYISGGLLPWLTATIELPLRGPAPFYASLGMEELELMDFLPDLADHDMLDNARVSGTTEVFMERDFSRYQALFDLDGLDVESRGQRIENRGNVVIGFNDGDVLTFDEASFESGGRNFSLDGAIVVDDELDIELMDMRVDGELDLGLLESARAGFPELFPEYFVDAEGHTDTDLAVRGTPGSFAAAGTMVFGHSRWSFRFLPEPMVIEGGRINFVDDGIEIPESEPLDGTVLGGATRVAGTMGYLEEHPRRMDMQMWSHNMSYRIPQLATLAFDTNLRLQASDWQDYETWLVSGDIDILDGQYHQEFNVVEQELAGRVIGAFQPQTDRYEAGLLEAVPMLNDIEFDMQLRARDGFRLRSTVDRMEADLEFRFDLLLQDTLANPRLTGDLDVIDGEVGFQGESFEVRTGTISFAEDVSNPYLDIEAGADVRNTCEESEFVDEVSPSMTLRSNIDATDMQQYHIMLNMQGELENLDIHMESNPYADQRDILSMILTGCRVDQLTASGASRPTLEVALGPLLGRLEREIADVVAVDEFTITPGVERTQVRVSDTLTRRLNWHFHLDTGFADATGGQQAQLELQLSDHWTAELSERSFEDTDDVLIDLKLNYRLPLD